ncbi:hypothetical protein EDD86DRAFT_203305 [Gorgonomyces haynaldii]|nr:hypothetical protein EDD86DRAFT_203305 [Gorgonomyces haynaldii]
MQRFDIAIVGGGVIGTATALAIAKSAMLGHKRICLIESGNLFQSNALRDSVYSNRVVNLNPTTQRYLQSLGAWDQIPEHRKRHFDRMYVWDSETSGKIDFKRKDIGCIVENRLVLDGLVKELQQTNVQVFNKDKVEHLDLSQQEKKLQLVSGNAIECDLVIGADGPNSLVRTQTGTDVVGWQYDQMGIVGTVKIQKTENNTAWQRFLPSGPIALLPLSDEYSSLVWSVTKKEASELLKLSPTLFTHYVRAAFEKSVQDVQFLLKHTHLTASEIETELSWTSNQRVESFPQVEQVDAMQGFPLRLQHATNYEGQGWALVGDAAHSIHPLGGQGMNLGLGDVQSLVQALDQNAHVGQTETHGYMKNRYPINAFILTGCDLMYRIRGRLLSLGNNDLVKNQFLKLMST